MALVLHEHGPVHGRYAGQFVTVGSGDGLRTETVGLVEEHHGGADQGLVRGHGYVSVAIDIDVHVAFEAGRADLHVQIYHVIQLAILVHVRLHPHGLVVGDVQGGGVQLGAVQQAGVEVSVGEQDGGLPERGDEAVVSVSVGLHHLMRYAVLVQHGDPDVGERLSGIGNRGPLDHGAVIVLQEDHTGVQTGGG